MEDLTGLISSITSSDLQAQGLDDKNLSFMVHSCLTRAIQLLQKAANKPVSKSSDLATPESKPVTKVPPVKSDQIPIAAIPKIAWPPVAVELAKQAIKGDKGLGDVYSRLREDPLNVQKWKQSIIALGSCGTCNNTLQNVLNLKYPIA